MFCLSLLLNDCKPPMSCGLSLAFSTTSLAELMRSRGPGRPGPINDDVAKHDAQIAKHHEEQSRLPRYSTMLFLFSPYAEAIYTSYSSSGGFSKPL